MGLGYHLSQKFSADYIQSDENLRSIKNVLSLLDDSKKEKCWESVTRAFEPYELLSLSEEKNPENGYFWDYSYIYDAIDNPELFVERPHSYVNWTAFPDAILLIRCLPTILTNMHIVHGSLWLEGN